MPLGGVVLTWLRKWRQLKKGDSPKHEDAVKKCGKKRAARLKLFVFGETTFSSRWGKNRIKTKFRVGGLEKAVLMGGV